MPVYQVYGLAVDSELPMPELPASALPPQVRIRYAPLSVSPEFRQNGRRSWNTPEFTCLFRDEWGILRIEHGERILVCPAPGADPELVRLWVRGPGLAVLLNQRGMLVLHAGVVELDGRAAVVLGDSGSGKSTTVAALCRQGARLLADDHAVVALERGAALVHPGYAQLKLFPEVLSQLGQNPEASPRLCRQEEKRGWRTDAFRSTPAPLACVYVLADGPARCIVELSPREAFMELVRNTFVIRLLRESGTHARHFRQCTELLKLAPVRRLVRPRRLEELEDLARFLLDDFSRVAV